MGEDEVADAFGVWDVEDLLGAFRGGGGGDREVADAEEALEEGLVDVDGADVAGRVILVAFGEDAAFEGDAVRVDAEDGGGALEPGDDGGDDEEEEDEVPGVAPPGGADFGDDFGALGFGGGWIWGWGEVVGDGEAAMGAGLGDVGDALGTFRAIDESHRWRERNASWQNAGEGQGAVLIYDF